MKDFTLPRSDWEIKLCSPAVLFKIFLQDQEIGSDSIVQCRFYIHERWIIKLAVILIRTVLLKPVQASFSPRLLGFHIVKIKCGLLAAYPSPLHQFFSNEAILLKSGIVM